MGSYSQLGNRAEAFSVMEVHRKLEKGGWEHVRVSFTHQHYRNEILICETVL